MHKSDNTRIYVHNQVYSCITGRMKPEAEAGQPDSLRNAGYFCLDLGQEPVSSAMNRMKVLGIGGF
jgi:hypothetical protein